MKTPPIGRQDPLSPSQNPLSPSLSKAIPLSKQLLPGLLIALAFLLINLVGLDRSPTVSIDEVTLNDPAKELARHGVLRSTVFAGSERLERVERDFVATSGGFEEVYFWQPPAQPMTTAVVYKLFGFGIWQTRVPGVLFGAGIILCVYLLGRDLFSSRVAGTIAALILAFDPPFVKIARTGRMDTECILFALVALLLLWRWRAQSPRSTLTLAAAGLSVGLATVTHPVGFAWVGVSVALLFLSAGLDGPHSLGKARFERARVVRAVVPSIVFLSFAAIPGALWLLWAAQAPRLFAAQFLQHGEKHLTEGSPLVRTWQELIRTAAAYKTTPLLLLAYVGAFFAALVVHHEPVEGQTAHPEAQTAYPEPVEGRTSRYWVAAIALIPFLFNAMFMTKDVGYYYLHPLVGVVLAAGGVAADLLYRLAARGMVVKTLAASMAAAVLANAVLMGTGGRLLTIAEQWNARDYATVAGPIRQVIPSGSIVWGPHEAWYAVDEAGSELRLLGPADPELHDFAIVRAGASPPTGFHRVADLGQPLPAVFGLFPVDSQDYRMTVLRSDRHL